VIGDDEEKAVLRQVLNATDIGLETKCPAHMLEDVDTIEVSGVFDTKESHLLP